MLPSTAIHQPSRSRREARFSLLMRLSAVNPGALLPPSLPVARGFSRMPTVPRCLLACMPQGTIFASKDTAQGSLFSLCAWDSMAMRSTSCLAGMSAGQRARRSAPPSHTTPTARSTTCTPLCRSGPSPPIPLLLQHCGPSTPSRSEASSTVKAYPSGGSDND